MQPTAKAATRERITEAARELFWERGYEATAVADILERAQANSGSFYYFFKSKEQLLEAVLDGYIKLLYPAVMNPAFAQSGDPIERVFAVLDGYRRGLEVTGCTFACPIGRLALEIPPAQATVHSRIAQNFTGWKDAIRSCLDAAGPRLPADIDRPKLANFVLTVMEGAVMQARAYRSFEPYDASVEMLRDYFNRLQEQAKQSSSAPGVPPLFPENKEPV